MDNYLSYRWPEQETVPPLTGRKKRKARRAEKKAAKLARKIHRRERRAAKRAARRHPVLRVLAIILVLAIIAGALGAGSCLLIQRVIPMWMEQSGQPDEGTKPDLPELPENSQSALPQEAVSTEPVTTVERANVGLGVTLPITETVGGSLTPTQIYERVLPSVVSVSAYISEREGYGSGSGVIMHADGYILTNYHIIEGSCEVAVMLLSDSSIYPAKLVGYDEELDIAILKIHADGLTAAEFGSSDALAVGDPAYAIGNPMGYLYGTMTDGIVSYLDRVQTVGGNDMTLIQTSAVLNSGNSGGALVNQYGQVVGITVAKVSGSVDGSAMVEGIGFAIPISAVRPYINRILATGESWKPTIGITCYAAEVDGVAGIMVDSVDIDTPAYAAGLRAMDFIMEANGVAVDSVYSLKRVLGEVGVGGLLTCTVLRGEQTVAVTFALIDGSELG